MADYRGSNVPLLLLLTWWASSLRTLFVVKTAQCQHEPGCQLLDRRVPAPSSSSRPGVDPCLRLDSRSGGQSLRVPWRGDPFLLFLVLDCDKPVERASTV